MEPLDHILDDYQITRGRPQLSTFHCEENLNHSLIFYNKHVVPEFSEVHL